MIVNTPTRPWKTILYRLFAVLVGLSPLIAAEVLCRAFDWGRPTCYNDPFVGFSDLHPLFVLNEASDRFEIPKSRHTHFRPESFAARKPADERRIFVLGGSTVQGHPYAIQTSFTSWLELSLRAAEPQHSWRVINCGGISYASYRLVPILQEVLRYEPDLVIFCEGHNEFLEDRSYAHIKNAAPAVSWVQQRLARLRTFTLLRAGYCALVDRGTTADLNNTTKLASEVDARLDWRGGLDKYQRDESWKRGVIKHFEFNLRRMTDIAAAARVPLWFMTPVSNLDWPPFKSQHRTNLSAAHRQRFDALLQQARNLYQVDVNEALALLLEARQIDEQYALIHYEIGKCHQQLGNVDEARQALLTARDQDICPLRMLGEMHECMVRMANETGTPLIDADALFTAHSLDGIPGPQWLADHVHPTIEGHQLWADSIFEELVRRKVILPVADWKSTRPRLYEEHMARLEPNYFSRGDETLKGTLRWAYGRVTKERQ